LAKHQLIRFTAVVTETKHFRYCFVSALFQFRFSFISVHFNCADSRIKWLRRATGDKQVRDVPGSTDVVSVAADVWRHLLLAKSETVLRLYRGRRLGFAWESRSPG